jgi:GNAT superfamily N-acetyltransferase
MQIDALTGEALDAALADLAALRIEVFRAWPYLYEGDPGYETHYLRSYRDNPRAILIAARDGGRIVGAATGMPLSDHADASQMRGALPPVEQVFYCAESVLLPDYRGRGLGHVFFDRREAFARQAGFVFSAFCGVVRPDDHPLKPAEYRPLDGFWRKRGYTPVEGAMARFSWQDVDQETETEKPLQVWLRRL